VTAQSWKLKTWQNFQPVNNLNELELTQNLLSSKRRGGLEVQNNVLHLSPNMNVQNHSIEIDWIFKHNVAITLVTIPVNKRTCVTLLLMLRLDEVMDIISVMARINLNCTNMDIQDITIIRLTTDKKLI